MNVKQNRYVSLCVNTGCNFVSKSNFSSQQRGDRRRRQATSVPLAIVCLVGSCLCSFLRVRVKFYAYN